MYSILYTWIFSLVITSMNISCEKQKSLLDDSSGRRIIGGVAVTTGQAPYQAGLANRLGKNYAIFCGAVIVQPGTVLTAIHCLEKYFPGLGRRIRGVTGETEVLTTSEIAAEDLTDLIIVAGTLFTKGQLKKNTTEGMQWSSIKKIVYQDNYLFPLVADLCIVELNESFTQNLHDLSEILMQANISVMHVGKCSTLFNLDMKTVICGDSRDTDMSDGDAGGPLVCYGTGHTNEEETMGILVGLGCGGKEGVATFYTRISSYSTLLKPYYKPDVGKKASKAIRHTATKLCLVYVYFIIYILVVSIN